MTEPAFWREKRLRDLSRDEWEALCDGCGKCCVVRLRDDDTGAVVDTDVACRLLDVRACRCSDYARRADRVPDCVTLTPDTVDALDWMPRTCAYRLVARGEDLPWWHHLVSGSRETVHEAGMSVRGRVIGEADAEAAGLDFEERVVVWPGEEDDGAGG